MIIQEEQSSGTSLQSLTPLFPTKSVEICAYMKRELPRELSLDALAEELRNFSQEELVYPSPKLARFGRNTATP